MTLYDFHVRSLHCYYYFGLDGQCLEALIFENLVNVNDAQILCQLLSLLETLIHHFVVFSEVRSLTFYKIIYFN